MGVREYLILLQPFDQGVHLFAIHLVHKIRVDQALLAFLAQCEEVDLGLATDFVILVHLLLFEDALAELKQLLLVLFAELYFVLHEELDEVVLLRLAPFKHLRRECLRQPRVLRRLLLDLQVGHSLSELGHLIEFLVFRLTAARPRIRVCHAARRLIDAIARCGKQLALPTGVAQALP